MGITNWLTWSTKQKRDTKHSHSLHRIHEQLTLRKDTNTKTKIIWIPSHTLHDADKRNRKSIKARLLAIEEKYGSVVLNTFLRFNHKADKLAATNKTTIDIKLIPYGMEAWCIEKKSGEMMMGKIYQELKNITTKQYAEDLEANSNNYLRSRRNIIMELSTIKSKTAIASKINNWLLRVRTNCLPLNQFQYKRFHKVNANHPYNYRNNTMYPDKFCSMCKHKQDKMKTENFEHLCTCNELNFIPKVEYHTDRIIEEHLNKPEKKPNLTEEYNKLANGANTFCKEKWPKKRKHSPSEDRVELARLGSTDPPTNYV
jgi:hypothetical protein